jgi:hypothetical protein
MALNLMEKLAASKAENTEGTSRKRMWSAEHSEQGAGGNSSGSGGRPNHRSTAWRDVRNSRRLDSWYQGGYGGGFGGVLAALYSWIQK